MPRPPKPASGIDNNKHHTSRKKIDVRKKVESELASKTRNLICPNYLSDNAKTEWARVVALDTGRDSPIIFDSDSAALELLCELRSAWLSCQSNWLYISKKERPQKFEEWATLIEMEAKLYAEMRKLGKELEVQYSKFGLTPMGRSKFGSLKAKGGDDEEDDNFFD